MLQGAILVAVGSATAVAGAWAALCQTYLKRVVAFSTCSQLGYMVAACGLLRDGLSVFHLLSHATLKAGQSDRSQLAAGHLWTLALAWAAGVLADFIARHTQGRIVLGCRCGAYGSLA
jgi:NADH:ubiquinone oxidoreductase subunit 4 (subunit M)